MFEELLARIGASLKKHHLPYMIIGGQAVLLYGEPRLTRDIDITLGVDRNRLDDLMKVVYELELKPLPREIESFVKETMVLPTQDGNTGIRVDYIFSFTPYEAGAINRAKKVIIMGQDVFFATPEDLIIHKIFAGRPRDMEDVKNILSKNQDIDLKYIRAWLKEFEQASLEKQYQNNLEKIIREL